uniref:Gag-pol polyprotein n=1 Tax=Solanum tuberosum TaxID=4113 RepID=M1DZZ8_SOLTU
MGVYMEQKTSQVPTDPLAEKVTNDEYRAVFHALAQAMTAQANRDVVAPINQKVGTTTTRVSNFTRMNPMKFHGYKVEGDTQEFINEAHKIIEIMGITLVEKAELATYQLKGVAQVLFVRCLSSFKGFLRSLSILTTLNYF